MFQRLTLTALVALAIPFSAAHAQRPTMTGPMLSGYLCCNMKSYGKQVSDINYDEATVPLAVGTPVQITGYDFRWFDAVVGGAPQRFKNDYSRDMKMVDFAKRMVVTEDPKIKLASYEPKVREAIGAGRVLPGMTREQVAMSIGWPITSENAPLADAPSWRYWGGTYNEYQVQFDAQGRVRTMTGDSSATTRIWSAAAAN